MPPSGVVRIGCNIGQVSSTIAYVCMHAQSLNPKPYSAGFPGGSEVKASACNVGDPGLIPGSGRSPGKGNGNPLQYSCLENPMEGEAWWATIHGVAKSQIRLSDFTFTVTLWTVAFQSPLSTGFSRQEYWSGLLGPPLGGLLTQGSNLCLLRLLN